jgi:superfamily I DNA/RNA helicase
MKSECKLNGNGRICLADLNPEQREAVLHADGPMLVLAGAGTGKTSVLTRRIARLIETGVKPEEILALTYTRKAACEMKERVFGLFGSNAKKIRIGTFHSLALEIVRRYSHVVGLNSPPTIGEGMTFDRLLILAAEILSLSETAKAELRQQFGYVLVDEYQDTNAVQFSILRSLLSVEENLFVVGDDDQSIFSFQGSSRELIRSFEDCFPTASVVTLTRNYRCSTAIIDLANSVMADVEDRFDKKLEASRDEPGSVSLATLDSCDYEKQFIADSILRFRDHSGYALDDIGVLVRSHDTGNEIGENLVSNGISTNGQNGGVHVQTLHSSKGLEFPIVFMPALEQGRLPHFASVNSGYSAIEEERRLFYVGVTRARDHLILSCGRERSGRTQQASEFVRAIPRRLYESL